MSAMPRKPTVVFRKKEANSSEAFSHLAWSSAFTKRTGKRMFWNMLRMMVRNSQGTTAFSDLGRRFQHVQDEDVVDGVHRAVERLHRVGDGDLLLVVGVLVLVVVRGRVGRRLRRRRGRRVGRERWAGDHEAEERKREARGRRAGSIAPRAGSPFDRGELRMNTGCLNPETDRMSIERYPLEPSRRPPWMKKTSPASASLR